MQIIDIVTEYLEQRAGIIERAANGGIEKLELEELDGYFKQSIEEVKSWRES